MKQILLLAGVAVALFLNGNPTEAATLRVADFGARGDGVTDDTAAVQRAFNALGSGDQLHFDARRTYLISQSLQMRNKSRYTVFGNGATIKASSRLPANRSANSYMIYILNNHQYTWENLTFDGNKRNRKGPARESGDQGTYHNVMIRGGSDFVFNKVRSIHAYMDGFYLSAGDPANTSTFPRRGRFLDSSADHNWRNGLAIINGYDIQVIGGSYSHSDGDWPMAGIQIEPNSGSAEPGVRGVSISHVTSVGNGGYGVAAATKGRSENITVDRSYFSDNARGGVSISAGNMKVQNSVFESFNRGITTPAYGGTLNVVTRGNVDVTAAGSNYNATILTNTFREISTGRSAIYIHRLAGPGAQVRDNCFERLSVDPIILGGSGPALSGNLSGGCPTNLQRLGWTPSDRSGGAIEGQQQACGE